MTAFDPFERQIGETLTDLASPRVPDYIDSAISRAVSRRQRRWWAFPERWLPMSVITGRRSFAPALPWRTLALLVLLGLLLVLAAAFVASNQRHPINPYGPARNGPLVFAKDGDVYISDASGAGESILVGGANQDQAPSFSHDGTRLGFIRVTSDGIDHPVVADADGANAIQLPVDQPISADWSPDNKQVVVIHGPENGVHQLSVVSTDAAATVRTLDLGGIQPLWFVAWRPPEGREIVFTGVDPQSSLPTVYAIKEDGTGLRALVTADDPDTDLNFQDVHISQDGMFVGYSNWEANAAGVEDAWGHVVNIDTGADRQSLEYSTPRFSPDGQYVVGEGQFQLLYGPADGHEPAREIGPKYDGEHSAGFDFSPDGTQVLLTTAASHQTYIIDTATGVATKTSWSTPDFPGWQRLAR